MDSNFDITVDKIPKTSIVLITTRVEISSIIDPVTVSIRLFIFPIKHDSISLRDMGKLFSFPTAAIHCIESKEIVKEVNVLPDNNKALVDGWKCRPTNAIDILY
jgi:hypothetical protein